MLQAEEYHNLYCHPTGKIWNFRYFLLHSHLFTDIVQTTAVTIRFCPRRTYFTSMIHKTVTQIIPFLRRNDLPECHLYFFGFFDSIDKTNTVCKADTVCVSYDCRFSKDIFFPHPEVLKGRQNLPAHFHRTAPIKSSYMH